MAQGPQTPHDDFGDRYAIERELGHGATASVYLARDLKFEDKLVAIKVLSADFALPVPSERFLREIETTAKLNHPHIVTLMESGRTRGAPRRPFYVMRYIDGETLRDILARGPLAVDDALRIARQVAGALGHAHRHGVIHRDIKPGNIMLEGGHTWVTDFGIARAMAAKDGQTVTSTGVTIGTPAYMSPEQAMGRGDLDARSDIYSLGCVLYEMLAGKMPFEGPDIQVVLHKHLVEPLPPLRELRPDAPERVEELLDIALAKKREDRFATAVEFAEALSLEGAGALTPTRTQPVRGERRQGIRWKLRTAVAAAATFVAGVVVVAAWALTRPAARPDRYLISPRWEYGAGVDASLNAGRLLQDALNEWSGIQVVSAPPSDGPVDVGALARRNGAGWYITGVVSRVGDSLRVRATLYGTRKDSLVRERSVNLAPTLAGTDSAFARLADRILFDDTVWVANGGRSGTRSVSARTEFARGLSAVQVWSLGMADSAFRWASELDERYAEAGLWLAQVRYWQDRAPAAWRSSLERAAVNSASLSRRDQLRAATLRAAAQGEIVPACAGWRSSTRQEPTDFAAWYGLATCLSRDDVVLADGRSVSGWSFRTSYREMSSAYQHAFRLLPSIHRSLKGDSYEFVRRVLLTNSSTVRNGHGLVDRTTTFIAHPAWAGDSLALVPYPLSRETLPTTLELALRHERELFHEIATSWVTAYPTSADALEALAISLDLLGDPTAADTLRRARLLATTDGERLRAAAAEVLLRLRYAVPFYPAGIATARQIADSMLDAYDGPNTPEPLLLATLAVLTGRGTRAAAYMRQPSAVASMEVPPALAQSAGPLLIFATLGAPIDSIRVLEEQVESGISFLPDSVQQEARMMWLARAAQLAFPDFRFASLADLAGHNDYMIDAQVAFLGKNNDFVRRMFDTRRERRRFLLAGNVTLDALYPEAWLLNAIGEPQQARAWLAPTLSALRLVPTEKLSDPVNAAALIQAMALQASLSRLVGDTAGAARWEGVVGALWQGADTALQPHVQRMKGS
ncbi:MAG TPA: serine/threonine-protein kinase [Gemmatimonadales bacterium]|nr:serine/threonine-protein kinase [Gemmatimonadales bacterium]